MIRDTIFVVAILLLCLNMLPTAGHQGGSMARDYWRQCAAETAIATK